MTNAGPVLADTVTQLTVAHAGHVVVTGSHGGRIAAAYAARGRVRAAIFNDAGRGRDDAGVAGLAELARAGIPACAVDSRTAQIGDAAATLAHGVVSMCNDGAAALGVAPGMSCADAAARLAAAPWHAAAPPELPFPTQSRREFAPADAGRAAVRGVDSIGLVTTADTGCVLVVGSHCALHGGDPDSALPVAACAALFHDAGRGRGEAGLSRLPVLADRGIPAGAVDFASARIGDARSMWETGIVSAVNAPARALGVAVGMRVQVAVERLRAAASGPR